MRFLTTFFRLFLPIAVLAIAAPAASAVTPAPPPERHVAPTGSGTACTQASPCSLETGFTVASSGDSIVLAGGDYGSPAAPLTFRVYDEWKALDVYAEPGARPRIWSACDGGAITLNSPYSRLADVDVHFLRNDAPAVWGNMSNVDHVRIESQGGGLYLENGVTSTVSVTNTLVHDTGEAWVGLYLGNVQATDVPPVELTLRNDTIVQEGAGSLGIDVVSHGVNGASAQTNAHVHNSIMRGVTADVQIQSVSAGDSAAVDADHSSFATHLVTGAGAASVTPNNANGNQATPPSFADLAADDLRQAAGSPTIDAGAADPLAGTTDVDGDARVAGAAIDIGADEYIPPAPVDSGGTGASGSGDSGGQAPQAPASSEPAGGGATVPQPVERPATGCVVPRVTGKTLKAARAALAKAGCAPGKVRLTRSRRRAGKVIAQAVRPGAHVKRGTRIRLVVGRR